MEHRLDQVLHLAEQALGDGRFEKAAELARQCNRSPLHAEGLIVQAHAEMGLGDFAQAATYFSQAGRTARNADYYTMAAKAALKSSDIRFACKSAVRFFYDEAMKILVEDGRTDELQTIRKERDLVDTLDIPETHK